MFDSENEINQKLGNCVVLKDNRPFYVIGARNASSVVGNFQDEGKEEAVVRLNDPTLDFKNLGERLGYINLRTIGRRQIRECLYLMRQPIRRSIQGLHDNNVFISRWTRPGNEFGQLIFRNIHTENGAQLKDTFNSVYPSLAEVRRDFQRDEELYSRAVHRNWCVQKNLGKTGPRFNLIYKMDKVGGSEDLESVRIFPKFKFLERDLREIKIA